MKIFGSSYAWWVWGFVVFKFCLTVTTFCPSAGFVNLVATVTRTVCFEHSWNTLLKQPEIWWGLSEGRHNLLPRHETKGRGSRNWLHPFAGKLRIGARVLQWWDWASWQFQQTSSSSCSGLHVHLFSSALGLSVLRNTSLPAFCLCMLVSVHKQ